MSAVERSLLSAEALRLLFERSQEPSFAYDIVTRRIVQANDAAMRYYGYDRDALLALELDDLLEASSRPAVHAQLQTGTGSFELAATHLASDGRRLAVEMTDSAFTSQGRMLRLVQVRDIEELERHRQATRRQLEAVLTTVATMLRMRDPFTDRHQYRVAALTTAMLREMDVPTQEAIGIVTAATVHDIGKQSVPAEILTFAGQLGPAAAEVVRTHSQAGHDLIAPIDAPWPLAQMILEHHERLDGSGYPRGLAADETLLGSRVIAVADTAEAMMSHRPYRAALGEGPALAELSAGKSIRYDAQAVEACFQVIQSHDFHFPDSAI